MNNLYPPCPFKADSDLEEFNDITLHPMQTCIFYEEGLGVCKHYDLDHGTCSSPRKCPRCSSRMVYTVVTTRIYGYVDLFWDIPQDGWDCSVCGEFIPTEHAKKVLQLIERIVETVNSYYKK